MQRPSLTARAFAVTEPQALTAPADHVQNAERSRDEPSSKGWVARARFGDWRALGLPGRSAALRGCAPRDRALAGSAGALAAPARHGSPFARDRRPDQPHYLLGLR